MRFSNKISIEHINLENKIFDKISAKLIEYTNLIPFDENEEVVKIAGTNELMIDNLSYYKLLFSKKIDYYVINKNDFNKLIEKITKKQHNSFYHNLFMKELEVNEKYIPLLNEEKEVEYLKDIKTNTIVGLVDNIIEKAILMKASDIHFIPSNLNTLVKVRVEGELINIDEIKTNVYDKIVSRIKVLSQMDITKHLVSQDGKFVFKYDNHQYDIRSSVIPTLYKERITLRVLDNSLTPYVLEDVFMSDVARSKLNKILTKNNGLILVVGPTGSGKTTTLYSLIKKKIDENVNIITVEDPIEYTIDGITQVQINEEIGITYIDALKRSLRQDPDVFMIGEIRDKEAAEITIRSAMTGHLVFSTIHANDSVSAIYRLMDFNISQNLIVNSLRAVIYQKLVKRICPVCKGNDVECGYCNNTREKGRICIAEVLIIDDELRKVILEDNFESVLNSLKNKSDYTSIEDIMTIAKQKKLIH